MYIYGFCVFLINDSFLIFGAGPPIVGTGLGLLETNV
jgi:hypothetical protein